MNKVQEVFEILKQVFVTQLVLVIFNLEREIQVEIDSLDYTIGTVLSQPNKEGKQ